MGKPVLIIFTSTTYPPPDAVKETLGHLLRQLGYSPTIKEQALHEEEIQTMEKMADFAVNGFEYVETPGGPLVGCIFSCTVNIEADEVSPSASLGMVFCNVKEYGVELLSLDYLTPVDTDFHAQVREVLSKETERRRKELVNRFGKVEDMARREELGQFSIDLRQCALEALCCNPHTAIH